jgi:hypothetical protein
MRGFPHTRQPLGHADPALCRVRVGLEDVLLDQRPSLPILRHGSCFVVRMVHRYYAAVRLLEDVHTGRAACAFARRPAASTGVSEVSRFSCRKCLGVSGVYDYAGRAGTRASVPGLCCLPPVRRRRRPDCAFSKPNTQPTYSPVYASLYASRRPAQNSGPSGSLLLSREEFSSSASCRFIPALSGPPLLRSAACGRGTAHIPP